MTENLNTENTAPDPESFNLADWLTGGTAHRPTRSVTVYRDLHLSAELERVRAEITAYEQNRPTVDGGAEESLGEDTDTTDLQERAEELLARLRAVRADLTVRGLIRSERLDIEKTVEPGEPTYDYEIMARAVEFPGGQHLTPEQWAQFHGVIGEAQFRRIIQAYQAAEQVVPDVSAPFSRPASRPVTGR